MTCRYVAAARMAAAGVLGITFPRSSSAMKEESRLRVISDLEASVMRFSLETYLGSAQCGVRPVERALWMADSSALR